MRALTRFCFAVLAVAASPAVSGCATTPAVEHEVVHAPPARTDEADGYAQLVIEANGAASNGEFARALQRADAALAVRPFGVAAGVAKVEAHLALGQRTQAVDFAARLQDRNPTRPEAYYALGKALSALGRGNQALDVFAEGLRHAPDDRWLRLGHFTAAAGLLEVPLDELEAEASALLAGGPDADVLNALGMAHELRGDNAAADALYVRAIAARPGHAFAHYNLARLRHASDGLDAARPHYQAFLEHAPPTAVREIDNVKTLLKGEPP